MKIVAFVRGGVISRVLSDTPGVQLLVLDEDVGGCDADTRVEVGGTFVGLDAMLQGAAVKHSPEEVMRLFAELSAKLHRRRGIAEDVRTALFP
jgi:ABC-type molybdenum transport system ATPase subunit/photorepair protein PhrA